MQTTATTRRVTATNVSTIRTDHGARNADLVSTEPCSDRPVSVKSVKIVSATLADPLRSLAMVRWVTAGVNQALRGRVVTNAR